mgnify:CR=1 FL=1
MIGQFIKGLFFGSLAGGLGGLLFAPKSVQETREQMIRYLDETTEATLEFNDSVQHLKDAVMVTRKSIDETIPVVTESFTKDLESFKFQAQPRIERIKTQLEQLNQHVTTIQAKPADEE